MNRAEICQTGECINLCASPENAFLRYDECAVEAVVEFIAAYSLNEFFNVVRHIIGVLHGISFLESYPGGMRVEILNEVTVDIARTHELCLAVKQILPSLGKL